MEKHSIYNSVIWDSRGLTGFFFFGGSFFKTLNKSWELHPMDKSIPKWTTYITSVKHLLSTHSRIISLTFLSWIHFTGWITAPQYMVLSDSITMEKGTKLKENRCFDFRKWWQKCGRLWWGLRSVCRVLDTGWPKQSRTRCLSLCRFNYISPVIEFSWGFGSFSDSTVLILGKRTGSSLTLWIFWSQCTRG